MKGYKTIIFNVLLGALYLLDLNGASWGLSAEVVATVGTIGNFILRFFTNTKPGAKN